MTSNTETKSWCLRYMRGLHLFCITSIPELPNSRRVCNSRFFYVCM